MAYTLILNCLPRTTMTFRLCISGFPRAVFLCLPRAGLQSLLEGVHKVRELQDVFGDREWSLWQHAGEAVEPSQIGRAGFEARDEGPSIPWQDTEGGNGDQIVVLAGRGDWGGGLHRKSRQSTWEQKKQALEEEEAFTALRRWEGLSRGSPNQEVARKAVISKGWAILRYQLNQNHKIGCEGSKVLRIQSQSGQKYGRQTVILA